MTRQQMMEDIQKELEDIAWDCEEEGYPSWGSNYELRAQAVYDWWEEEYPELWE